MSQILRSIIIYVSFLLVGVAIGWFAKKTDVVVKELEQAEEAQKQTALNVEDALQRDADLTTKNQIVYDMATKTKYKVVERIKEIADEKNCADVTLDPDIVRLLNNQRTERGNYGSASNGNAESRATAGVSK